MSENRIPLADAALRTGLTYQQIRTLLFQQKLKGGRDDLGRFYVEADDVSRFLRERSVAAGRHV